MQRCRGKIHRCILLFFGGDKKARDKVELVRGDAWHRPLGEPCRISHYGIYSEAPERSRPFPTAYFILRCKHTNDL